MSERLEPLNIIDDRPKFVLTYSEVFELVRYLNYEFINSYDYPLVKITMKKFNDYLKECDEFPQRLDGIDKRI